MLRVLRLLILWCGQRRGIGRDREGVLGSRGWATTRDATCDSSMRARSRIQQYCNEAVFGNLTAHFVVGISIADSTLRSSRAVPHPSTNRALRRLTSEVRRDPVHSARYGRRRILSSLNIHVVCRAILATYHSANARLSPSSGAQWLLHMAASVISHVQKAAELIRWSAML